MEPTTTLEPISCWWLASALTAEVISGVSAARAAISPSMASVTPSRFPIRSMRDTSTQLAPKLTAAPRTNATASTGVLTKKRGGGCRGGQAHDDLE